MPTTPRPAAPSPVLILEASSRHGSVALLHDGGIRAAVEVALGRDTNDPLFEAVGEVMATSGLRPADLQAVVCGSGPGSFTSLRMAAALAKGLADGIRRPLYAVSSLVLTAAAAPPGTVAGDAHSLVVVADALRAEWFVQRITRTAGGGVRGDGAVERLSADALRDRRRHDGESVATAWIGVGAAPAGVACDAVLLPAASALPRVAEWAADGPVDLAGWEPAYGRLAEAQVQWEARHGRPLPADE